MSRVVMQITNAAVKFGPLPTPPTPIDGATLTDYGCQVTEARITAAPKTTTVPATFCIQESTINVPSAFTLELSGLQDWDQATMSISQYLFKNDATIVAFALYLDGENDPAATGQVSLAAGDFGGVPGTPLVFKGSLPIIGYPDITDGAGLSLRGAGTFAATASADDDEADAELESESVA